MALTEAQLKDLKDAATQLRGFIQNFHEMMTRDVAVQLSAVLDAKVRPHLADLLDGQELGHNTGKELKEALPITLAIFQQWDGNRDKLDAWLD